MSAKPYEFLVEYFQEDIEYLVLIIDFGYVAQTRTYNCSYSMTGVKGYPNIYKIIKKDGWIKYADKKDADVNGRYRHYFRRPKRKPMNE